jgi:UDP-N-acetylmuramate dehydrogenase
MNKSRSPVYKIEENVSLKQYNTFGINVKARYLVRIKSEEAITELIKDPLYQKHEKLILGGGSNLLFTRDFEGLVIKNEIKGISIEAKDDKSDYIISGAGEIWHDLVEFAIEKNLGGIENLSLIPGTVGAAPMQNIGAYGVEIKETFVWLKAADLNTGEIRLFDKDECEFGYRESIFKNSCKDKYFITSVCLKLNKEHKLNTSYGIISDTLKQMNILQPDIKAVSRAVIAIRQSKLPDPAVLGNAGSFFKNPVIDVDVFKKLEKQYPEIPSYPVNQKQLKVPAGWLIESCGFKGKQLGNTGTAPNQALVIVNHGKARGKEIIDFAKKVQQAVQDKFGIKLQPEVNIVNSSKLS